MTDYKKEAREVARRIIDMTGYKSNTEFHQETYGVAESILDTLISHVEQETRRSCEGIVVDTELSCAACNGSKCEHTLWCKDRKRILAALRSPQEHG